jgi:hypothetical protein
VAKRLGLGLGLGWATVGLAFGLVSVWLFGDYPTDYVDVLGHICSLAGLVTQGAVAGFIVGVVLEKRLGAQVGPGFVVRHIVAFLGSLITLMLIVELIDRGWGIGIGDDGLWGPGAVCLCGCCTLAWVNFVMFPAAVMGETFLQRQNWSDAALAAAVGILFGLFFPVYSVWAFLYSAIYAGASFCWLQIAGCSLKGEGE